MKKRIVVAGLLVSCSLWIGLTLFYRTAYQRGYRQGANDAQLRSQLPVSRITRASPVFQETSLINEMPVVPSH